MDSVGSASTNYNPYRTEKTDNHPAFDCMRPCGETSFILNGIDAESPRQQNISKKRHINDPLQMQMPSPSEEHFSTKADGKPGRAMVALASTQRIEQWNPRTSIFLTGTAKGGMSGPPVGLVDIGISKAAYLFRVALPGVKKDDRHFNCEIERDGKVQIQGTTTTGESVMLRDSRVFQMTTQYLCPPGPFTISFHLPGPVDSRSFTANFGSDGIFEGIVLKYRGQKSTTLKQLYS